MTRTESQRRRILEVAIQQLPTGYRSDTRIVLYVLKGRNFSVRGTKISLDRTMEVLNKAIAAIDILEG
jgi:hypothetical protein